MATMVKSIVIKAPVEKVFAYVEDPTHTPEYWPSMLDIRDVKDLGGGKKSYNWTYKMAGMKLEGSSEYVEYVKNERIVMVGRGGIESHITWIYTPVEGGTATEVLSRVEYTVPVPVLGRLAESLILKQNEHEAESVLVNLKTRLEAVEPVEKA